MGLITLCDRCIVFIPANKKGLKEPQFASHPEQEIY